MDFNRYITPANEEFRHGWVIKSMTSLARDSTNRKLLDVGAGASPYRDALLGLGYEYHSHDFNSYSPQTESSPGGLQNETWSYHSHDFVCDILDIPSLHKYDFIVCTEVLEHVPDPVRAFSHMVSLLNPGGVLVVTVPFMSLMNQAPYWFQSGLSPFWFEYWGARNSLATIEISVFGDYVDFMNQELTRTIPMLVKLRGLRFILNHVYQTLRRLRQPQNAEILSSGGFGSVYIGKLL